MLDSTAVEELRPPKNRVDTSRPYLWLHEQEPGQDGVIEHVQTIFLTNSECPFKCVMCDLWKQTTGSPTPSGAIPEQIRFALKRLLPAPVVKLYNNGNFFDPRAIPPDDLPAIATLLDHHRHVIVENHPAFCGDRIPEFRDRLRGSLEIAMGLETVHPEVLPALNKKMSIGQFAESATFLLRHGIQVRAFILLNPPFLTDPEENVEWCLRSVDFAFECGAGCCSIIPVRGGNGAMEKLASEGHYEPPTLSAVERVFASALKKPSGRVFVDLWDIGKFATCMVCFEKRRNRLQRMNLQQSILPEIQCSAC